MPKKKTSKHNHPPLSQSASVEEFIKVKEEKMPKIKSPNRSPSASGLSASTGDLANSSSPKRNKKKISYKSSDEAPPNTTSTSSEKGKPSKGRKKDANRHTKTKPQKETLIEFKVGENVFGKQSKTALLASTSPRFFNDKALPHAIHVKTGHDLDVNFACKACPSIPTRSIKARFGLQHKLLLSDTVKIPQSINHLHHLVMASELGFPRGTQEELLASDTPKHVISGKMSLQQMEKMHEIEFLIISKVANFIVDRCKHFEEALKNVRGRPVAYINANTDWGIGDDHKGSNFYGQVLEQLWWKRFGENNLLFQTSVVFFGDQYVGEIDPYGTFQSHLAKFQLIQELMPAMENSLNLIKLSSITHSLAIMAGNFEIEGKLSANKIATRMIELGQSAKQKFPWVTVILIPPLPQNENTKKVLEVSRELRKLEYEGEMSGLVVFADISERLMIGNKQRETAFNDDKLTKSGSDEILAYLNDILNVPLDM